MGCRRLHGWKIWLCTCVSGVAPFICRCLSDGLVYYTSGTGSSAVSNYRTEMYSYSLKKTFWSSFFLLLGVHWQKMLIPVPCSLI